jgi:hypothetical protein
MTFTGADVGGSYRHQCGTWTSQWARFHSTLAGLCQDSSLTLRHGSWPQSCVDIFASKARLLGNGEVHANFDEDNNYVGPTYNHSPPSSHVVVNCLEGYIIFCIATMKHMLNQFRWQELYLDQIF